MKAVVFNAVCPYEIGDKVTVAIPDGRNENGKIYTMKKAVITDIACVHYLKSGEVIFTYELDGSGQYAPIISTKEAGLTV